MVQGAALPQPGPGRAQRRAVVPPRHPLLQQPLPPRHRVHIQVARHVLPGLVPLRWRRLRGEHGLEVRAEGCVLVELLDEVGLGVLGVEEEDGEKQG